VQKMTTRIEQTLIDSVSFRTIKFNCFLEKNDLSEAMKLSIATYKSEETPPDKLIYDQVLEESQRLY
jgi:hypothetical protein